MDPATSAMIDAIEANWDARTPVHVASRFYDVPGRDPADWFADFEWADLGDLTDKRVAHLQCHIGSETLAFAARGAEATGLDISGESVKAARAIAAEKGLAVDYVKADVHDAVSALGAGAFDVVYTGKGAVCYLPDLDLWAEQVAGLLTPGGTFYLVEFHPLLNALGPVPPPDGDESLLLRHDYLGGRGPIPRDGAHTYTDGPALPEPVPHVEWAHGLGAVVTALVGAGLRIDLLRETERLPWPRWSSMGPSGSWFALPEGAPRIPLIYALRARR
ncbi:class I SAM-dependent methyltransferase [Actinokineospora bangkokensis]|uniref:Methyltransferase type 12 n=1 Tax=Actinokineospora bangkokensis TaxID=1193682 RepID=A0A1Q9LDB3_9PSEU|nr:class I SAM-dependent methyltransferase [Actinokineospora bangkokensis]OLR89999.1 methyltransferase type 12 [Actinokineospora bangkokensis]